MPFFKMIENVSRHFSKSKKIRVALLIDEFFGGAGTAYGGYGFLARKFIAKYIPDEDIEIDVLLGKREKKGGLPSIFALKEHCDNVDLHWLPRRKFFSSLWLAAKHYDLYLSIELTDDYVLKCEKNDKKKLILMIQDPRPKRVWKTIIGTMKSIKDPCFYRQEIYQLVHDMNEEKRIKFITQGNSLNPLALELYNLENTVPISYVPNPIEIDFEYRFNLKQKKTIIFLGRLEAQKLCWIFCEIARQMPQYNFIVLGNFFRHIDDNKKMMREYLPPNNPKNLIFKGHVDGEEKKELLKSARILINTSIWEGIPISWLECLSYGTVIISAFERDDLVSRFGEYVGEVPGDGFDSVNRFKIAIDEYMNNDELYVLKATQAIEYTRNNHSIKKFKETMKHVIHSVAKD